MKTQAHLDKGSGIAEIEAALTAPDYHDQLHETLALLRREAPVYWSPALGYWFVTSHALVEEVLSTPGDFSSFGAELAYISRLPPDVVAELNTLVHHFNQPGLIHSDGAKHTQLRRVVNPAFVPAAMNQLRDRIQARVDGFLGHAPRSGSLDVIEVLAKPVPVAVIAALLGVPDEDLDRFPGWSSHLGRFFTGPLPVVEHGRDLDRVLTEWRGFVDGLLRARAEAPREDFLTRVALGIEAGSLTREDAIAICVHALQAGHETTTNLIGNMVHSLLTHPSQLRKVLDDPGRVPDVVEETLRFEPPALNGRRTATVERALGGAVIRAGDTVVANVAGANRDPAHFERPDEFDIDRGIGRADHFGFGRGAHICLGAPLARVEAAIALTSLLPFLEQATLESPTPAWRRVRDQRGLTELRITIGRELGA